ncbi:hypothetical protein OG416_36840 (plasmid) [Streptomyces longwoodensis]|uniref:hypothetical protein n=1 Tax=Streptomyces longwoodensis TaxID=68231 RepID=UPI002F90A51B|nr:hypothetical protein OG416_36840 [Streptomyces longwoodensis]
MSAHLATPAVTALAVTAVVLLGRWAASRPRRHSPSTARPPWRRTSPTPALANSPEMAVRDAEVHVHRYWQELQAHPDQTD